MAQGSLIKVDEFTVSSGAASVIIGGGTGGSSSNNYQMSSTYDVYALYVNGLATDTDDVNVYARFVSGNGTVLSASSYAYGMYALKTYNAFEEASQTGQSAFRMNIQEIGTTEDEDYHGIHYIHDAGNTSNYTFMTIETVNVDDSQYLHGNIGGGGYAVVTGVTGIQFYLSSGNINGGTFSLYGLKK